MTDAPERIWIEDERPLGGGVYVWNARNNSTEEAKQYAVEYIRADLVEALEAENQRLRKALKEIDHGDGWGWCGQIARAALSGEGE